MKGISGSVVLAGLWCPSTRELLYPQDSSYSRQKACVRFPHTTLLLAKREALHTTCANQPPRLNSIQFSSTENYQNSSSMNTKINGKLACRSVSCSCFHVLIWLFPLWSIANICLWILGSLLIWWHVMESGMQGNHLSNLFALLFVKLLTSLSLANDLLFCLGETGHWIQGGKAAQGKQRSNVHMRLATLGNTPKKMSLKNEI